MNAMPISPADFIEDHVNGSDSDTNFDDDDDDAPPEYYQPISAANEEDEDPGPISNLADEDRLGNGEAEFLSRPPSNGNYDARRAENGMSSLRLNDDVEERNKNSSEDEEEEERMREAANSAITRAFREDENRRNTPLTPENAMRVMEAMRGISFGGVAPDWADRVPENHWMDQLRRLRQPRQA